MEASRDVMFATRALGHEDRVAEGRRAVMAYAGTGDAVFQRVLHQRVRALVRPRKIRIQKTAVVFMGAVFPA